MKVMRKMMIKTNEFCIGDQIKVKVRGMGTFTATVQKIFDDGEVMFMFDQCVARKQMNPTNTNKGGYLESELRNWMFNEFAPKLPAKITSRLIDIGIPSYGMMFGHDEQFYKDYIEPDNDEQLELMKILRNRVADYEDEENGCGWYWLSNATKKDCSSTYFAYCYNGGSASYANASHSYGVRPYFVIG